MPISDNPVIKLSSNTNGHDYVIGDLHGCYDLLEKLLELIVGVIHDIFNRLKIYSDF
jgi:hypothetical protein